MSPNAADHAASLQTVRQYQSDVAAIREAPEPRAARYAIHTLAAIAVAFLLTLTFGRVDRVVTSLSAKMVTAEPETVVQALDPSIIKSIDVKEGEQVQKGQLLATLDPTFAASTVNQLRSQINGLKAQIARDNAEIAGKPLVFAPSDDPDFAREAKIQSDFYEQQMANYKAQINSFDQKIELDKATIQKYRVDAQHYKQRTNIAQQIEDMRSTLEQHGAGSVLDRLTSADTRVEAQRNVEFDDNSIKENQHALASAQADRDAFVQQFLAAASQDLATAEMTLGGAEAQLEAAVRHKDLVRITAAEDSIVLSVATVSVGSVLKEGDTLMTLTPTRVPVEAEVKISTRDVAFVRPGDPVTMKIDAYDPAEYGTVEGTVRWISDDAVDPTDTLQPLNEGPAASPSSGAPSSGSQAGGAPISEAYYKALVTITKLNLSKMPKDFRLMPGMTLGADIKIGSRTLAKYILGSMMRGAGEPMRNP